MAECQIFLGFGLRGYEIRDGFRLREIHLAGHESSTCELTGFSRFSPGINEPTEEFLLDKQAAVARYFYGVFAGKRMRRTEDGAKDFIEHFAVTLNTSEMDGIRFGIGQRKPPFEEAADNRQGIGTGNTNDRNSSCPIGGRYSTNS